jgi:hypothetical protein
MARHIDLRDLIPPDDEKDTLTMPDGKTFFLPSVGVNEMSRLLMAEEELDGDDDTFTKLARTQKKVLDLIRGANRGRKVPDYDFSVDMVMDLISILAGASPGTVSQAVREALAAEDVPTGEAGDDDASQGARELAEAAGMRSEEDEAPLGSAKPSRKRSSRSGTSGNGGRSGGKASAGRSSSRTSEKPSASRNG